MRKIAVLAAIIVAFTLSGCATFERSENPINRSILLDTGIELGLDGLPIPIPLPSFKLGFKLHYRRPTAREEIELNLSKLGRQLEQHNQVPKDKLRYMPPAPFSVEGEYEEEQEE